MIQPVETTRTETFDEKLLSNKSAISNGVDFPRAFWHIVGKMREKYAVVSRWENEFWVAFSNKKLIGILVNFLRLNFLFKEEHRLFRREGAHTDPMSFISYRGKIF